MNKIILIGRISRDPINQSTQSGIKYSRFKIAVNRPFSDNQTDYIPIVAWRNQAAFIENYLEKGSLISIEGRFTSSTYKNNENQQVTNYEVTAERIESLESKAQRELRRKNKNFYEADAEPNFEQKKVINFAEENKISENSSGEEKENKKNVEDLNDVPWELDDL